jgi:methyl-accepting chemotaxis protein
LKYWISGNIKGKKVLQRLLVNFIALLLFGVIEFAAYRLWLLSDAAVSGRLPFFIIFTGVLITAVLAVCSVVCSRFVQKSIVSRINKILETSQSEDTSFPDDVQKYSAAAAAVERLIDYFMHRMHLNAQETTRLLAYSNKLVTASERLRSLSDSQEQGMTNIHTTINTVNASLSGVSSEMLSLYTAIEAESDAVNILNDSVGAVHDRLQTVTAETVNSVASIAEGRRLIEELLAEIKELSSRLSQVSGSMESFRTGAHQISGVIRVINEISERTHLLATNAAIEAARAGAVGRGFSVVANEIRQLADSSSQSVEEVDQTIITILETLNESFTAFRAGNQIVNEFVTLTGRVSVIFNNFENLAMSVSKDVRLVDDDVNQLSRVGQLVRQHSASIQNFTESFQQMIQEQTGSYKIISDDINLSLLHAHENTRLSRELSELGFFLRNSAHELEESAKFLPVNKSFHERRRQQRFLSTYRLQIVEDRTGFQLGLLDDYSEDGIGITVKNNMFTEGQVIEIRVLMTQNLKEILQFDDVALTVVVRRPRKMTGEETLHYGQDFKDHWHYGCEIIKNSERGRFFFNFLRSEDEKSLNTIDVEKKTLLVEQQSLDNNNPFIVPENLVDKEENPESEGLKP